MTQHNTKEPIFVLSNHQLVNKVTYRNHVWVPALQAHAELPSRAAWLEALPLIYEYTDRFFFKNGKRYMPSDIDTIFRDPQNRWMSNFLKADGSGMAPASYSHQYERLRMIELYCRLRGNDNWPVATNSNPPSSGGLQIELPL